MDAVTDTRSYARGKQLMVARALLDMLVAADAAGIAPMRWTANVTGWSLHGEIDHPLDPDPRGTFEAWVRFLGLRTNQRGDRAAGRCPANTDVPVGIHNLEPF